MASVARRHFRRTTVPPSAFYNLNETILSLQTNEVLESWILTEAVSCRQVAKQRTTRACIMRFSHNICPGPFPDQICCITRRAVSSLWDNRLPALHPLHSGAIFDVSSWLLIREVRGTCSERWSIVLTSIRSRRADNRSGSSSRSLARLG